MFHYLNCGTVASAASADASPHQDMKCTSLRMRPLLPMIPYSPRNQSASLSDSDYSTDCISITDLSVITSTTPTQPSPRRRHCQPVTSTPRIQRRVASADVACELSFDSSAVTATTPRTLRRQHQHLTASSPAVLKAAASLPSPIGGPGLRSAVRTSSSMYQSSRSSPYPIRRTLAVL